MTANQINYANLKEAERTHLANEEIGRRQAAVAERQAAVAEENLLISREANAIAAAQVAELQRSHQASEAIQAEKVSHDYELGLLNYGTDSMYKGAMSTKAYSESQYAGVYAAKAAADTSWVQAKTATENYNTGIAHAKVYQEQIGIIGKGIDVVDKAAGLVSKAATSIMTSMYGAGVTP